MGKINVHFYPSTMTHESRIFKESKFISDFCDFDRIILLGLWERGLKKEELLEQNIFIKRVAFFGFQQRSVLYILLFLFIFIHRPKKAQNDQLTHTGVITIIFFCKDFEFNNYL